MMALKIMINDVVVVNDVIWCFGRCIFQMSHQCHIKIKDLEILKCVTLLIPRGIAGCGAVG